MVLLIQGNLCKVYEKNTKNLFFIEIINLFSCLKILLCLYLDKVSDISLFGSCLTNCQEKLEKTEDYYFECILFILKKLIFLFL